MKYGLFAVRAVMMLGKYTYEANVMPHVMPRLTLTKTELMKTNYGPQAQPK